MLQHMKMMKDYTLDNKQHFSVAAAVYNEMQKVQKDV